MNMVALVRDPYDRLISAWKSKFQCDAGDEADRAWMVPNLLKLARVPKQKWKGCLSITDFAMVVQQVYLQGDACKLEPHVLPQSFGCFAEIAPAEYRVVTTAKQIGAMYPDVRQYAAQAQYLFLESTRHSSDHTGDTQAACWCRSVAATHTILSLAEITTMSIGDPVAIWIYSAIQPA